MAPNSPGVDVDTEWVKESPSVFAAHATSLFVSTDNWLRIKSILKARRGGNYGLAGPRGSGKTWLMMEACDMANKDGGLGVWFPSPSEYDPKAFLASLSEVTAQKYITQYLGERKLGTESGARAFQSRRVRGLAGGMSASVILYLIGVLRRVSDFAGSSLLLDPFILSSLAVLAASTAFYLVSRPRKLDPKKVLFDRAREIRTQARFSAAYKDAAEANLGASMKGLTGALKRSIEENLAERPATISSLIHDFRNFVSRVAEVLPGPIVISIDELDKMHSADDVATLLRDVKGVFDVAGCTILPRYQTRRLGPLSHAGSRLRPVLDVTSLQRAPGLSRW